MRIAITIFFGIVGYLLIYLAVIIKVASAAAPSSNITATLFSILYPDFTRLLLFRYNDLRRLISSICFAFSFSVYSHYISNSFIKSLFRCDVLSSSSPSIIITLMIISWFPGAPTFLVRNYICLPLYIFFFFIISFAKYFSYYEIL